MDTSDIFLFPQRTKNWKCQKCFPAPADSSQEHQIFRRRRNELKTTREMVAWPKWCHTKTAKLDNGSPWNRSPLLSALLKTSWSLLNFNCCCRQQIPRWEKSCLQTCLASSLSHWTRVVRACTTILWEQACTWHLHWAPVRVKNILSGKHSVDVKNNEIRNDGERATSSTIWRAQADKQFFWWFNHSLNFCTWMKKLRWSALTAYEVISSTTADDVFPPARLSSHIGAFPQAKCILGAQLKFLIVLNFDFLVTSTVASTPRFSARISFFCQSCTYNFQTITKLFECCKSSEIQYFRKKKTSPGENPERTTASRIRQRRSKNGRDSRRCFAKGFLSK